MLHILTIIAPLFLIIFASAVLQRWKPVSDTWSSVLNAFALKVGFPVLIFTALAKTTFSFQVEAPLILANSLFIIGSFVVAWLIAKVLRLSPQMTRTLFICFAFGNVAYLGIPVLTQLWGAEILPTASLIVAVYLFWVFTLGIGYLDYATKHTTQAVARAMLSNVVKNPLLISVILGLLVGSLQINLPPVVLQALEMVSASVTPIVLIVIGLFIGSSQIGKVSEWIPVGAFCVVTLLLLPAGFFGVLTLLGIAPADFASSIIEAAMPLAITPFALADQYNLNKTFIARTIALSTLLSVVSLPFWVSLVG